MWQELQQQNQGQLITHSNTLQEDALEIVPTMRTMSTALTPLSVSSVIMAEIQQPLPISNTNAFAATAKPLSQFLSDSAVPMGSEMTTRDVLAALINEQTSTVSGIGSNTNGPFSNTLSTWKSPWSPIQIAFLVQNLAVLC